MVRARPSPHQRGIRFSQVGSSARIGVTSSPHPQELEVCSHGLGYDPSMLTDARPIAFLATIVPSLRAARLNPIAALRHE